MRRFRLSGPAQADLIRILSTSTERWGEQGRRRYAATLTAALHKVAAEPSGPATRDRSELSRGLRSFHVRHVRSDDPDDKVRRPVHVLFYRAISSDVIEIVRVLHERMEPSRHVGEGGV
ncbi:MAG: type II toxin-antitoxin system RelE/ParE family toxin [Xanthobacteraceae bacterium]|nr:type II toxin-antitoxin system RelE/ParE family toxin [Xanthobacteraceae bacterium]